MLIFLDRSTSTSAEIVTLNSEAYLPLTICHSHGIGDAAASDDIQTLSDELMDVEMNEISNEECAASEGKIRGYFNT